MGMKYTPELNEVITKLYQEGQKPIDIGRALAEHNDGVDVPERSVIAKLSSLGVYKKKEYVNKRGEAPIKKEEYITRISKLLDVNAEILESLEKVNKGVLILLEKKLSDPKL